MEILEAYDLVGTYRAAAVLAGCDHHTVKRYVERRDAGLPPDRRIERVSIIDEFRPKIDELVKRSHGKVRADVVHDKLVAMGFTGTPAFVINGRSMIGGQPTDTFRQVIDQAADEAGAS